MDSLIDAAIEGNSLRVRKVLQQGAHPDTRDHYGETALTWAAYLGHTAVVKDMLAAGADREVAGSFLGATPVILAAKGGHRGTVALLAVLADVNAQNTRGETALMFALEQNIPPSKSTHRILSILETLVHAGADVNLQDQEGNTALMRAVRLGRIEVVQFLLLAGADIRLKNDAGQTALDLSTQLGHKEIVELLHRAGASE